MGFHLETYDLPVLHDYAAAKRRFENTKPIRGRVDEVRPLGKRSKSHVRIEMGGDGTDMGCDTGDNVHVVLYSTRVVTYYPDGRIRLYVGNWSSDSTHQLINHVVPFHPRVHSFSGKSWFTSYHGWSSGEFVVPAEGALMQRGEYNTWELTNPERVTIQNINRKGMNEVRREYKPLYNYVRGLVKLTRNDFDGPNIARLPERMAGMSAPSNFHPTDDPEMLYQQVAAVARERGHSWISQWVRNNNPKLADASSYIISLAILDRFMRANLPDRCISDVELPLGVKKKGTV
jgi:hypothetical protein